jgi:RimJ/RimL family protein N-acetyltransferase
MKIDLRPAIESDISLLKEIDNDSSMNTYDDWKIGEFDPEIELIEMMNYRWKLNVPLYLIIEADDEAVGYIQGTPHKYQQFEIGYYVVSRMNGKGIASESLKQFIEFAYDNGIHRCYCEIDPRNVGSVTVAERAGMVLEGTMKHSSQIRGDWTDDAIYAIVKE